MSNLLQEGMNFIIEECYSRIYQTVSLCPKERTVKLGCNNSKTTQVNWRIKIKVERICHKNCKIQNEDR